MVRIVMRQEVSCRVGGSRGGRHTIPLVTTAPPSTPTVQSAQLRLGAAAVAGLLLVLGFPPFEWTLPAWAGLVGLIWLLGTAPSARVSRWSAYLFALAFFGVLLWWLSEVELLAFYPLVLLQAAPWVLVGSAVFRFRDARPAVHVLAAAGAVGLAEFVRVRWPYGGFPWGAPGLTVSGTPLRPSAQWFGSSGWTVLLVAVAAVLALWVRGRVGLRAPLAALATVIALALVGNVWPAVPDGPTRSVTIVQGNSPCPGVRCPNERTLIFQSHLELTAGLAPGSADLVVWPESSTGSATDPVQFPAIGAAIGDQARRIGATFLVGGDRDAGPENFINANVIFDETGDIVAEYRKRHPVPFGEYVPLRSLLDWIPALDRVPRDMLPGDVPVIVDLDGVPFASVISYEGAFARYERQSVREGAAFVVVATNEASFGETPSSDQFLAISRVRAAELGIDIVHSAVTGRSAFVHADGRVEGLTGLYERTTVSGSISARLAGPTLYARWGDWVQVLAILGYLALVATRRMAVVPGEPAG